MRYKLKEEYVNKDFTIAMSSKGGLTTYNLDKLGEDKYHILIKAGYGYLFQEVEGMPLYETEQTSDCNCKVKNKRTKK